MKIKYIIGLLLISCAPVGLHAMYSHQEEEPQNEQEREFLHNIETNSSLLGNSATYKRTYASMIRAMHQARYKTNSAYHTVTAYQRLKDKIVTCLVMLRSQTYESVLRSMRMYLDNIGFPLLIEDIKKGIAIAPVRPSTPNPGNLGSDWEMV